MGVQVCFLTMFKLCRILGDTCINSHRFSTQFEEICTTRPGAHTPHGKRVENMDFRSQRIGQQKKVRDRLFNLKLLLLLLYYNCDCSIIIDFHKIKK